MEKFDDQLLIKVKVKVKALEDFYVVVSDIVFGIPFHQLVYCTVTKPAHQRNIFWLLYNPINI
jgi:hypothetical protein